ncbi:MAG: hypothetical protein IPJ23_11870 [Ignavibacteriales bacterium]|nr:hypothetical protein [Ignavibacteriales bacterium]
MKREESFFTNLLKRVQTKELDGYEMKAFSESKKEIENENYNEWSQEYEVIYQSYYIE